MKIIDKHGMISSDKKNNDGWDSKSVVLTRHSTRKDVAETGVIRMFVGAPDGAVDKIKSNP